MTGSPTPSPRPLDLFSVATAVVLCLSWGVTHVAIKIVLPEVPPFIQAFVRSGGGAFVVFVWTMLRGVPLLNRDGTLRPGLVVGVLFGIEFLLLFAACATPLPRAGSSSSTRRRFSWRWDRAGFCQRNGSSPFSTRVLR